MTLSTVGDSAAGRKPWPIWRWKFLDGLAECGNVKLTCKLIGIGRTTAYRRAARDEAFRSAWLDSIDGSLRPEIEARQRSLSAVLRC